MVLQDKGCSAPALSGYPQRLLCLSPAAASHIHPLQHPTSTSPPVFVQEQRVGVSQWNPYPVSSIFHQGAGGKHAIICPINNAQGWPWLAASPARGGRCWLQPHLFQAQTPPAEPGNPFPALNPSLMLLRPTPSPDSCLRIHSHSST